jgi:RNA polymerase sigma factor (sigma-70 family)
MVEAGSDNSIMLRVRDGHLEELGVLFERHHVKLLNFFMRMTGNRSVSEDLVQDSFLRIVKYRGTFRVEEGNFDTWMFRLARSAGAEHFKRSLRARTTELDETLAGDAPSALERIESDESARLLKQSILELPPDQREVLVLRTYHFKKFSEIAQILDCSDGAARIRAHRAVTELRRVYHRLHKKEAP